MSLSWPESLAVGSQPLVIPMLVSPSIRHCDANAGRTRFLTRHPDWADYSPTVVGQLTPSRLSMSTVVISSV
jgi:hypothetical protein